MLSTTDYLKSRLLPADLGESSDYDDDISAIGAGLADLFLLTSDP